MLIFINFDQILTQLLMFIQLGTVHPYEDEALLWNSITNLNRLPHANSTIPKYLKLYFRFTWLSYAGKAVQYNYLIV